MTTIDISAPLTLTSEELEKVRVWAEGKAPKIPHVAACCAACECHKGEHPECGTKFTRRCTRCSVCQGKKRRPVRVTISAEPRDVDYKGSVYRIYNEYVVTVVLASPRCGHIIDALKYGACECGPLAVEELSKVLETKEK